MSIWSYPVPIRYLRPLDEQLKESWPGSELSPTTYEFREEVDKMECCSLVRNSSDFKLQG